VGAKPVAGKPVGKSEDIQFDGVTRIKKFDMSRVNVDIEGQRVLIVGQSGSGKSSVTLDIMRYNKHIPVWMIVSPTEKMNNTYSPHVHPGCIHDDLVLKELRDFKKRQELRCGNGPKGWRINDKKPFKYRRNPSAACILDDVVIDAKLFKDAIFRWAYFNSRHAKTMWIQLTQYAMLIPSEHRKNIKFVFLFQQGSNSEIKKLYEEWGGAFNKLADFKKALQLCTSNFKCMVIDCLNPSMNITEKIFYYAALKDQPDFKVGAPWWWAQMERSDYDHDWEAKIAESSEEDDDQPPKKKAKKATKKAVKRNEDLDIELE
jgi:ABC-type dipeptide/oligopeptide/nickel transport system ATPase component